MLDPLTAAYLAGAAANVTSNILQVLGKRWSQDLMTPPRQQALERCYQAALAALVPDDELHQTLYQPLLEAFISDPAVIAELAKLVRGRTPDLDTMVDSFAEVTAGHTLPPMNVTARLAASVEAFVQVAEQESALATIMQTAHLREATQSLRALARDVQAIRQAVDLATSWTGDVTTTGDITADNLVTGTQTIHEAAAELDLSSTLPERITMQDLLHQGERLVLIGAPGCGKTTVLQHIAWTLAEALRTHQPDLATASLGLSGTLPLPIYVPLSLYADHRRQFATDPDPHRRQLATFINHYLVER